LNSARWWTLTACYAIAIIAGSVIPIDQDISRHSFDKWIHVLEYMLFALLLFQSGISSDFSLSNIFWISVAFPILYGGLIELIQHFLPYRSMDVMDFVTNAMGVFVGNIFCGLLNPKRKRQVQ
jgi:VanZ family protein